MEKLFPHFFIKLLQRIPDFTGSFQTKGENIFFSMWAGKYEICCHCVVDAKLIEDIEDCF